MGDQDDLQGQLRRLFQAELEEGVAALNAGILRLEQDRPGAGADTGPVPELFRIAHGLKGAALSTGVQEAVGPARRLEESLAVARDDPDALGPELIESLLSGVDALAVVARELRVEDRPQLVAKGPRQRAVPRRPDPHTVRVPAHHVDDLVGRASEIVTVASQVDGLASAVAHVGDRSGAGMPRETLRTLAHLGRTASTLARDMARVTAAVTAGVERLTLQPFGDICAGLDRTVRDLARDVDKRALLVVDSGGVEVDRAVADMLREPLLHLVRNAVDHGIETPAHRRAAGKPEVGTITIRARLRQGRLTAVVADDGRGVDREALGRSAEARGLNPGEDELAAVFIPGVSTVAGVTDVSGRGVGLDAVRARLEAVGGTVGISSNPGQGTAVTLDSPASITLLRVLLMEVGQQTLALPLAAVERIVVARPEDLQDAGGQTVLRTRNRIWPIASLAALFGATPANGDRLRLALVKVGSRSAALAADAFAGERALVVKPLPERLAGIPELIGAAVLPDGTAVLVLNPAACVRRAGSAPVPGAHRPGSRAGNRRRVLVAEDALTTRVFEQRILEAAGYEVATAVDGVEAWEALQREGADLVVSDVGMPRMDGFQLCRTIRRSRRWADTPVVLVTSLGSEEDRRRGVEAGADAYIVKAEFEADRLIDAVARLL